MLITPNIALVVFAVVLVASFIASRIYPDYASYDKCWFHTFIATLAGLGVFVTFMFYYNVVSLQYQQQIIANIEAISNLNSTLLNSIVKETDKVMAIVPNFVLSLSPLAAGSSSSSLLTKKKKEDETTAEAHVAKMNLSYRIFSVWQDILMTKLILKDYASSYITNFLQKANSRELYALWATEHINFIDHTQTFGDLLFKYAQPITEQTTTSYLTATQELMRDPIYSQLIYHISK